MKPENVMKQKSLRLLHHHHAHLGVGIKATKMTILSLHLLISAMYLVNVVAQHNRLQSANAIMIRTLIPQHQLWCHCDLM